MLKERSAPLRFLPAGEAKKKTLISSQGRRTDRRDKKEGITALYSKSPTIAIEAQGMLFALANRHGQRPPINTRRGLVTVFTDAARLRLMRKLARIDSPKAVFMTLTFPARYPDPQEAKSRLRALLERFRRAYPRASAVWRLEPQKRGAPHFHLLWYNLPYIKFEWLREVWGEILADYVDDTLPFVRLNLLWNQRQVMNYVSKYVAKSEERQGEGDEALGFFNDSAYLHAGRHWGIHNAKYIPWAVHMICKFVGASAQDFELIKRLLSLEWEGVTDDPMRGAVIFTDHAQTFFENAYEILHRKG